MLADRQRVIADGSVAACPLCQCVTARTSFVHHIIPLPLAAYEESIIEKVLAREVVSTEEHHKRYLDASLDDASGGGGSSSSSAADATRRGFPTSPVKAAPGSGAGAGSGGSSAAGPDGSAHAAPAGNGDPVLARVPVVTEEVRFLVKWRGKSHLHCSWGTEEVFATVRRSVCPFLAVAA